jgi:hypothetical protein
MRRGAAATKVDSTEQGLSVDGLSKEINVTDIFIRGTRETTSYEAVS